MCFSLTCDVFIVEVLCINRSNAITLDGTSSACLPWVPSMASSTRPVLSRASVLHKTESDIRANAQVHCNKTKNSVRISAASSSGSKSSSDSGSSSNGSSSSSSSSNDSSSSSSGSSSNSSRNNNRSSSSSSRNNSSIIRTHNSILQERIAVTVYYIKGSYFTV
ncbi:hypothetical protein FHG87_022162 [Trinorchestia longiramus]|nr:hypothetical protein FHG87_022162 [Trinorchestia longiramus]